MLWFHEYDDLDVEVGDLAGVKWDAVEKEEMVMEGHVKKEVEVKVEDVGMVMEGHVKKEVEAKVEDVGIGMDGRGEKGGKM